MSNRVRIKRSSGTTPPSGGTGDNQLMYAELAYTADKKLWIGHKIYL